MGFMCVTLQTGLVPQPIKSLCSLKKMMTVNILINYFNVGDKFRVKKNSFFYLSTQKFKLLIAAVYTSVGMMYLPGISSSMGPTKMFERAEIRDTEVGVKLHSLSSFRKVLYCAVQLGNST